MAVPVAPTALEAAAREHGPLAYVVTVGEDSAPHVVQADVQVSGEQAATLVGTRTAANARVRARICLLFPSRHDDDRTLIVDGVAEQRPTDDLGEVIVADRQGIGVAPGALRHLGSRPFANPRK